MKMAIFVCGIKLFSLFLGEEEEEEDVCSFFFIHFIENYAFIFFYVSVQNLIYEKCCFHFEAEAFNQFEFS